MANSDCWTQVINEIVKLMSKREREEFERVVDQQGSARDAVIYLVRKNLNPDMLTVDDVERCMQKVIKINAYANALGGTSVGVGSVANEVIKEAFGVDRQQNNPFYDIMKQMMEDIRSAMLADLQSKLGIVVPKRSDTYSGGVDVPVNDRTNHDDSDEFTGDK